MGDNSGDWRRITFSMGTADARLSGFSGEVVLLFIVAFVVLLFVLLVVVSL